MCDARSAVVEEELTAMQDAPVKVPCSFKDCSCFIREEQRFCGPECEKKFLEQSGLHSECPCGHADCVRIPGMDAASIFAQRNLN
ncbi:MAG: hypothetical protein K2W95_21115 [Candidatus Obscuribacterales bacterium]|nr:hypothetical protein [Candidatus Obscuribacterales bacterium]